MTNTMTQLLPGTIDNTYRGRKLAPWLLALVVFVKFAQSMSILFGGSFVVSSADGIPLDTYPSAAAQTIVSLAMILGLYRLATCALASLVMARYRSMIAFTFAMLLVEDLAKRLILQIMPIARAGTPPGPYVGLGLLALTIVGLALSLWRRGDGRATKLPQTTP